MDKKIFQRLADIAPVATAHSEGQKYVFLNNGDSATPLTQFAYGKLMPGESSGQHSHPTMEECFFFVKGAGICTIDGLNYSVEEGAFLRIPPGVLHNLKATGDAGLEFVYFGVATT